MEVTGTFSREASSLLCKLEVCFLRRYSAIALTTASVATGYWICQFHTQFIDISVETAQKIPSHFILPANFSVPNVAGPHPLHNVNVLT